MNLLLRLLSALLLLPLVIGLGYLGGWPLFIFVLLFGGMALWELLALLHCPCSIDRVISLVCFVLILAFLKWRGILSWSAAFPLVFLIIATYSMFARGENKGHRAAHILFSSLYLGILLSFVVLLRDMPDGFFLTILFLLSTFASDTVAYFVGKFLGRIKIFPRLSPSKTLEGTLASPLGGILGVCIVGLLFSKPIFPLLPLGILISVFALVGDLFESIFKRQAQVKDSSQLIPGHGGFLDRLDSLLFTAPLVYFYSVYFLGR